MALCLLGCQEGAVLREDVTGADRLALTDAPEADARALLTDAPEADDGALLTDAPEADDGALLTDAPGADDGALLTDAPGADDRAQPDQGLQDAVADGRADLEPPERILVLSGSINSRDFGGWAVGEGSVRWRTFYRGGQLSALDEEGCLSFAALGIRTIVDLREAYEVAAAPNVACTEGVRTVLAPLPKLLPPTDQSYRDTLAAAPESLRAMLTELAQPGALPAFVHCVIGRDRASVAVALILLALGVSREDIVAEFLLSNDAGVAVEASWVEAVLDEVEAAGGIDAYLVGLGVTQATLEALRGAGVAP